MKTRSLCLLFFVLIAASFALAQKESSGSADPILQAMHAELDRSRTQLKLENMSTPYYIDYRVMDLDVFQAEAFYGALRTNVHTRVRYVRVEVRLGNYKQDSFYGRGVGTIQLLPLDNDIQTLRHQIWLATDEAYKAANEALTEKQAQLNNFTIDQPVDDFAQAEPVHSLGPLAKSDVDLKPWLKLLQTASALGKSDSQIETFNSWMNSRIVTRYYINSEGTEVRDSRSLNDLGIAGSTQASDGMRLERNWMYVTGDMKELPSEKEFLGMGGQLVSTLKQLREAPLADEEYHGPVLFSADAASSIFSDLVGDNVLGIKPELGQSARTTGAWATSYKIRVLPDFISVEDDPTLASMNNRSLLGHYDFDDEGVKAIRVPVVENGKLMNYLIGRTPIRDFPTSNGHGRAQYPVNYPGPSLGNLIVKSSEPVPHDQLKAKLIEMCKQRDLPYGYFVETLGPQHTPRLLYRVWVKDGKEELVRGGIFGDLDLRSLRNDLVAAGDDVNIDNHTESVPHSIINPSILFDELEVKRENLSKGKLPEYPPPALVPSK
jgi:predicted Zn-dependent protease